MLHESCCHRNQGQHEPEKNAAKCIRPSPGRDRSQGFLLGTVSWNATSARAQVSALAPGPLPSSDMTELEVDKSLLFFF